jgi:hypothetical protein
MRRYAGLVEKNAPRAQREVAAAVLAAVVMSTPVGQPTIWKHPPPKGYVGGRARANWMVGLGAAPDGADAPVSRNAIADGQAIIDGATAGDIHITNNVPYIVPLNEGHSAQAPVGFVETAIQNGIARAKSVKVLDQ